MTTNDDERRRRRSTKAIGRIVDTLTRFRRGDVRHAKKLLAKDGAKELFEFLLFGSISDMCPWTARRHTCRRVRDRLISCSNGSTTKRTAHSVDMITTKTYCYESRHNLARPYLIAETICVSYRHRTSSPDSVKTPSAFFLSTLPKITLR